jgi:hypothetical protein
MIFGGAADLQSHTFFFTHLQNDIPMKVIRDMGWSIGDDHLPLSSLYRS